MSEIHQNIILAWSALRGFRSRRNSTTEIWVSFSYPQVHGPVRSPEFGPTPLTGGLINCRMRTLSQQRRSAGPGASATGGRAKYLLGRIANIGSSMNLLITSVFSWFLVLWARNIRWSCGMMTLRKQIYSKAHGLYWKLYPLQFHRCFFPQILHNIPEVSHIDISEGRKIALSCQALSKSWKRYCLFMHAYCRLSLHIITKALNSLHCSIFDSRSFRVFSTGSSITAINVFLP